MGEGFQLCTWDWRVRWCGAELNVEARKEATANIADLGPHWLEGWTLPLALRMQGILGKDFELEFFPGERKLQVVLSPPPAGGVPSIVSRPPTVVSAGL